MARVWTCRKCKTANVRTSSRRCAGCGENTKPALRKPMHRAILATMSYAEFAELSARIHGGALERCGLCGKPATGTRSLERDHDHETGAPRGLTHFQCNHERIRGHTVESARAVVEYLERVRTFEREGGTTA